jgi:hypothetical protein
LVYYTTPHLSVVECCSIRAEIADSGPLDHDMAAQTMDNHKNSCNNCRIKLTSELSMYRIKVLAECKLMLRAQGMDFGSSRPIAEIMLSRSQIVVLMHEDREDGLKVHLDC